MTKQHSFRFAGLTVILAASFLIQGCAHSTVGTVAIVSGVPVYDENSKASSSDAISEELACRSASPTQTNPLLKSEPAQEQGAEPANLDCAPSSNLGAGDSVDTEVSSEPGVLQAATDEKSDAGKPDGQDSNEISGDSSTALPEGASDSGMACESDEDCMDKGLGVATGTGFFISQLGFLVTNAHVIAGSMELYVLHNDETLPAEILVSDEENDLALLKVDIESPRLALQNLEPLKGAEVAVIGFPNIVVMGNAVKATFGHVNANSGPRGDDRYLQFDAPIQPGNSGSPLIDASGAVVGVATASLNQAAALKTSGSLAQNVNYAVKADFLLPLISEVPDWILAPEVPKQELRTTEIVAKAEASVVLIINVHDASSTVQADRKKDAHQGMPAKNTDGSEALPKDPMAEQTSNTGAAVGDKEQEGLAAAQAAPDASSSKPDSQSDSTPLQASQSDNETTINPSTSGASGTGTWYLYKERGDNDKR